MPVDPFETPLILTEATIPLPSLIPLHRAAKPFLKPYRHAIAEHLFGSLYRRLRVTNIARTGGFVSRLDLAADHLSKLSEQLDQCVATTARHIERLARGSVSFRRQQIRVDHVVNISKVTGLKAISINDRRFTSEQGGNEPWYHGRVL